MNNGESWKTFLKLLVVLALIVVAVLAVRTFAFPQQPVEEQNNASSEYPAASNDNQAGSQSSEQASDIKQSVHLEIPTVNQAVAGYPLGCEGISLYMALKGTGSLENMEVDEFMATQPVGETPEEGYMGDPTVGHNTDANRGKRTTIHPAPLAKWGSEYGTVRDISGATIDDLKKELSEGHVIIAWVTGAWADASWVDYPWGKEIENNHVLCVVGYGATGDILINDCHDGRKDGRQGEYWISESEFAKSYDERHFAVAVG